MSGLKQRLPSLAERRRRRLDQLRANQSESVKDANGSASNMLAGALRFLAVAEYVLNKDVKKFQSYLSESAELRCRLFQRYDAGDRISPSYVSMLAYKYLFAALAAGDNSIAKDLAARMGGRQEIEAEYDHPLDLPWDTCSRILSFMPRLRRLNGWMNFNHTAKGRQAAILWVISPCLRQYSIEM